MHMRIGTTDRQKKATVNDRARHAEEEEQGWRSRKKKDDGAREPWTNRIGIGHTHATSSAPSRRQ